jgi:hypothetical protein
VGARPGRPSAPPAGGCFQNPRRAQFDFYPAGWNFRPVQFLYPCRTRHGRRTTSMSGAPMSHHAPQVPQKPRGQADRTAAEAPALKASNRCPSCGRSPAVLFYAVYAARDRQHAPLVCLDCCPKLAPDA